MGAIAFAIGYALALRDLSSRDEQREAAFLKYVHETLPSKVLAGQTGRRVRVCGIERTRMAMSRSECHYTTVKQIMINDASLEIGIF